MYFWFPLLAGLSELTFDPRPDIRYSALEVLFDTLKFHGSAFTLPFWTRIFDSVLLPIFDHVRAEVQLLPCTRSIIFTLSLLMFAISRTLATCRLVSTGMQAALR